MQKCFKLNEVQFFQFEYEWRDFPWILGLDIPDLPTDFSLQPQEMQPLFLPLPPYLHLGTLKPFSSETRNNLLLLYTLLQHPMLSLCPSTALRASLDCFSVYMCPAPQLCQSSRLQATLNPSSHSCPDLSALCLLHCQSEATAQHIPPHLLFINRAAPPTHVDLTFHSPYTPPHHPPSFPSVLHFTCVFPSLSDSTISTLFVFSTYHLQT